MCWGGGFKNIGVQLEIIFEYLIVTNLGYVMYLQATSVDSQAKIVKFEDESSLNYTSLVIATGGK